MEENVIDLQKFRERKEKSIVKKIENCFSTAIDKMKYISNFILSNQHQFCDIAYREFENGNIFSIYLQGKEFLGHILLHNKQNKFVEICFQKVCKNGKKEEHTFSLKNVSKNPIQKQNKNFYHTNEVIQYFRSFFLILTQQ